MNPKQIKSETMKIKKSKRRCPNCGHHLYEEIEIEKSRKFYECLNEKCSVNAICPNCESLKVERILLGLIARKFTCSECGHGWSTR